MNQFDFVAGGWSPPKRTVNRVQARIASKKYRQKHPERVKESKRKHALAHPKALKVYAKKYYEKTGEERKAYRRLQQLRKYGLTPSEFEKLFNAQGRACAICRTIRFKCHGPVVDHCHDTGFVRGILCHSCNVILGHSGDSVEILERAKAYLKQ